ncbi:hypothetical protein M8C21_032475, partial [Ambrosia artemisiifolia]
MLDGVKRDRLRQKRLDRQVRMLQSCQWRIA